MSDGFSTTPKHGLPLRVAKPGRDVFLGLSTLWQKRWVPLSGLCLGAGLGLAVLLLSAPHYRATSQIMMTGGLETNIHNERAILESSTILGQVTRRLNLYQDPYFSKPRLIDRLSVYGASESALQERIFYRLTRGIETRVLPNTDIIQIDGVFTNPEISARIVNAVVDAYREQRMEEKFQDSKQVGSFVGKRLDDIRAAASIAQDDLRAFQLRHDPVYQNNVRAEIEIVQKQIGSLNERINVEKLSSDDVKKLSADLEIAQNKLANLEREAAAMAAQVDDPNKIQQQMGDLQNRVATGQRLYEQYVLKYQEIMAQHEINLADIRVISFATIPTTPDVCARLMTMLWLALSGFGLGLLYSVIRVVWARGFHTAQQLEGMTGYPVLVSIPSASGKLDAIHHHVLQDPAAILAESLRTLRVSLRLRGEIGRRPRVVQFTSTLPDEGKTSLSVMLATVAAKSGERVCIVDCDLRRPSLHKAFGIGNARGIADYLSDRLPLDEVIYRRDPSGVHLITAKAVPSYSLTLLTSGRMERLVSSLREQYDLVILDAPSSLAFADARVLAGMVAKQMRNRIGPIHDPAIHTTHVRIL